eukprot:9143476-Prorocentrum_lima.AAC.1
MHQRPYPEVKLTKRAIHRPEPTEGALPPVDKNREEYKTGLEATRIEVGSLQWVALTPRPHFLCLVAIAASAQTRNPEEAMRLLNR